MSHKIKLPPKKAAPATVVTQPDPLSLAQGLLHASQLMEAARQKAQRAVANEHGKRLYEAAFKISSIGLMQSNGPWENLTEQQTLCWRLMAEFYLGDDELRRLTDARVLGSLAL